MKYVLLIHHGTTPVPPSPEWDALPAEEQRDILTGWQAMNAMPGVTPGHGLQPPDTATTVRVRDGELLVTDGPYAELKEAIGGYFVVEADDLDGAMAVAAAVPSAQRGGAIEIRPIREW